MLTFQRTKMELDAKTAMIQILSFPCPLGIRQISDVGQLEKTRRNPLF